MNDPHVVSLDYTVNHGPHVSYAKAPPFEHEAEHFTVRIDGSAATITMKSHFASVPEAREVVEPFLRAWSLDMALSYGPHSLDFVFGHGQVIDRKPTPGVHTLLAEPATFTVRFGKAGLTVGLSAFPPPPSGMTCDPAASIMFDRYVLYREGGTTLADAANFCLTVLEKDAGSRAAAAQKLSIAKNVLGKLGELTATKGGTKARKASGSGSDFTARERQWLEQAMTVLIRRAAETAFDPAATRPQITMNDLPLFDPAT